MTNNDILRSLRYTFDLSDDQMIVIFESGAYPATRALISDWMKKDDHEDFKVIFDQQLAAFLNGFINHKRGKKEGEQAQPEEFLNNNIILRKLRIALNFKDEDMLAIFALVDRKLSKHELSAFFRKPEQKQYRRCQNQLLRNFLHGLKLKYRPNSDGDNELA